MRPRLQHSVGTALGISLLFSAYILTSEFLHLTQRNPFFVADLGGAALHVFGWYAVFAVASGIVVGVFIRDPRAQAFVLGAAHFTSVSMKVLWLDAALLTVPAIAVAFAVFGIVFFGIAVLVARRWSTSSAFPIILVVAYVNICLGVASGWAVAGGRLVAFLLAQRTMSIVVGGAVCVVVSLVLQWRLERGATARWRRAVVPGLLFAGLLGGIVATKRTIASGGPGPRTATTQTAPELYILSFDALRSDALQAFIAGHPQSQLATLSKQATTFQNVVSHGTSTDSILANNTLATPAQSGCKGSVPMHLSDQGYFTAMIYAGLGRRFEGSVCYEYFFAGDGSSLVGRFTIPALAAVMSAEQAGLRSKALPAATLIEKLESISRNSQPLYAYLHFLELHAPYLPEGRANDQRYIAGIRNYMQRCYTFPCDPEDPANRELIKLARGGYIELLDEVDWAVGHARTLAERRGRPFIMVITADHGELFGEHGGFAHGGGFVTELLDIPFLVFDSRRKDPRSRCELMLSSEAVRATALGAVGGNATYPDHDLLTWQAAPLGEASIDRKQATIRYQTSDDMRPHAGTWHNIHRDQQGTLVYPLAQCE